MIANRIKSKVPLFIKKPLRHILDIKKWKNISYKIKHGLIVGKKDPQYAWGLYHAAHQAKSLGFKGMTAIEFGVGEGFGIIAMEQLAKDVEREIGIKINVYGFDNNTGLPPPTDYRDIPYRWQKGFFKMSFDQVRAKLKFAELVIGDVKDTISDFLDHKVNQEYPIGFISFDLDYYSSTKAALEILNHPDQSIYIPRIIATFDSASDQRKYMNEFVGEPLARNEFNSNNPTIKITKIEHLGYQQPRKEIWCEKVYACHMFNHKLYNSYIPN